jgi:hypothetical protein
MIEVENYTASLWPADPEAEYKEKHGIGYTAWIDGKPVVSSGVMILWRGLGHGWFEVHDQRLFMANIKPILRGFKVIFPMLFKSFHRIQADVMCQGGTAWAKHLGLAIESIAKKYGPNGEDAYRYARIN